MSNLLNCMQLPLTNFMEQCTLPQITATRSICITGAEPTLYKPYD